MIKKPDVLSDEEIDKVIGTITAERYLARHATSWEANQVAQAQLDVCVKHYEPLIKELYEALREATSLISGQTFMMCKKVLAKVEE